MNGWIQLSCKQSCEYAQHFEIAPSAVLCQNSFMTFFDGKLPADLGTLPLQAQQELAVLLQSQHDEAIVSLPVDVADELSRRGRAIDNGKEALTPAKAFLAKLAAKYT